ncbi:sensor histidine kinase [Zunongwangia sp. HRR-M8]|uniref:sensor histidine kinase n=1 Tax=Zunongwangia sp. HRR-M8 TaxID=3015170 RepID=UPI0022DDDF10|nr:GAF domain-containing sensor histidine kinase [Zunongwangia sp. HRR-M8]WBL23754.1 GAF domain-containing sensor histidine kinase [Zunongwangia sp. HRR-M8]
MIQPATPLNEKERLSSLNSIELLKGVSEEEFDNITQLASYICKTPISLITLVETEKNWYKSNHGGPSITESERRLSHCAHAILEPGDLMEVQDLREDLRFKDNPFTSSPESPILYYAGMPLLDNNGYALGTLCVLDTKINKLDEDQKMALKALAKQVEKLFELRRKNLYLEKIKQELDDHNSLLKDFAGVVSHDMKMPLANMIITADLIKARYKDHVDKKGQEHLANLKKSALKLSDYINGILNHYESDRIVSSDLVEFDLHHLLEDIIDLMNINDKCEINFPSENIMLNCNRSALEQILINLINNSIKYNNKEEIIIDIESFEDENFYYFTVKDNGIGIPQDQVSNIFQLFKTLYITDRQGNQGNGIGLSTVKKLVTSLGGKISVQSVLGESTCFEFSIKKAIKIN